jgi:acetyl-CoA carboxylase carboxyltransferase component
LSEKIKFHIDYLFGREYIISLLTKLSQEMIKDKEKLALEKHKAYIYYLVTRNFDDYRKNINHIKKLVDDLPDSEFIIFWELMGLIEGDTIHIRKMDLDTIISKDNSDIYDLNKHRIEKIFQNSGRSVKINSQS